MAQINQENRSGGLLRTNGGKKDGSTEAAGGRSGRFWPPWEIKSARREADLPATPANLFRINAGPRTSNFRMVVIRRLATVSTAPRPLEDIFRDLAQKALPLLEPLSQRFDEPPHSVVALLPVPMPARQVVAVV